MKLQKNVVRDYTTIGVLIVAFAIVFGLQKGGVTSNLINGQLIPICCWCIMAISLNLTVGVLGELSLGHAGFMSVGAFVGGVVCMLLRQMTNIPDLLALIIGMIAAAVAAAIVGLIIGIPVLRLRGDYLAIVTLAFGEIIKSIITNIYLGIEDGKLRFSFINALELGEGGKLIIKGPTGMTNIPRLSTFLMAFVVLLICLVIIFNLVRSRTGRAIMALRDNRIAAESVGINVVQHKLLVFSLSAAMAGVAGTLYAFNLSTISASKFGFNQSILVLVFVVLGGLGNMGGSIIAATLLTLLPELLREFSTYRMLVYAIVLILVMLVTNNPTLRRIADTAIEKIKKFFKILIGKIGMLFKKLFKKKKNKGGAS